MCCNHGPTKKKRGSGLATTLIHVGFKVPANGIPVRSKLILAKELVHGELRVGEFGPVQEAELRLSACTLSLNSATLIIPPDFNNPSLNLKADVAANERSEIAQCLTLKSLISLLVLMVYCMNMLLSINVHND